MTREPSPPSTSSDDGDRMSGRSLILRLGRAAILILAVIATALVGIWLFRTDIATTTAKYFLRANGSPNAALSVDAVSINQASITQISLPPHLNATRLEITYSLKSLMAGRLKSIAISGLKLNKAARERSSDDSNSISITTLPVDTIKIESALVSFNTPNGEATAEFDLNLGPKIKGTRSLKAKGTLRRNKERLTLSIDGTIAVDPAQSIELAGAFTGEIRADGLNAPFKGSLDAFSLQSGQGWARVALADTAITTPAIKARISNAILQINHTSDADLEIDATGDIHIQQTNKQAWPIVKFAIGGVVPMGIISTEKKSSAPEFHLVLDSSKIWGRLEGRVAKGSELSGTFDFNGIEDQLTAKARGSYQVAFGNKSPVIGKLSISSAGLWRDSERIALLSGALSMGGDDASDDALFSLAATINPDWAASQTIPEAHASGVIQIDLEGALPIGFIFQNNADIDAAAVLRTIAVEGDLAFGISSLDAPGLLHAESASGLVHFTLKNNALALRSTDDLTLTGASVAQGAAPPFLRRLLAGDSHLRATPEIVHVANLFDRPVATFAKNLSLQTPNGSIRLLAPTRLNFAENFSFQYGSAPKISISATAAFAPVTTLTLNGVFKDVRFKPKELSGRYRIAGIGAVEQGSFKTRFDGNLDGAFSKKDEFVKITLTPNSALKLTETSFADAAALQAPLTLAPTQATTVSIDISANQPRINYDFTLKPIKTVLSAHIGGDTALIPLSLPSVSFSGSPTMHKITVEGGDASLPAHDFSFRDISLALSTSLNAKSGKQETASATLAIETIEQRGDTRWVAPLNFHAAADIANEQVTLTARLDDNAGNIRISASGTHDLTQNAGQLSLETGKITFLPTVLQPDALSPMLRNSFREVDGDVDIKAEFVWRDGVFKSSGEALIEARKLVTNEYSITNAATLITFDSLSPLSTPPRQIVDIGAIDIGVPITDGRVVFQLQPNGAILAGLEKFNLFGGRIETRPFILPKDFENFTIPLAVTGVQLDELLAIAKFGEMSATGALDGLLPLTISHGEVAVRGGVLETIGPGALRYEPKDVGDALSDVNAGAALFLDIVKDFQYDKIRVTLDEGEFEEIAFGFKIDGRNNDVYDGIPVNLNITLSGPLRQILQQGYETFTTPAWLQDKIRDFEQK